MNMRKSMKILSLGLLLSIPFATHPMELPDLSQAKKPVASWFWNKWNNVPTWKTIKETVSATTNAVVNTPQAIKTVAAHTPSLGDMAQATKSYVQNSPVIQEQAQNAVVALSNASKNMPSNPTLKKAGAVGALAATGYLAHKAYQWINAENTALPSFQIFEANGRVERIGQAAQLNEQGMPVEQLSLQQENQTEPMIKKDMALDMSEAEQANSSARSNVDQNSNNNDIRQEEPAKKSASILSQYVDVNDNKKRLSSEANKDKAFLVSQQNRQLTDSKLAVAMLKYDAALKDFQAGQIDMDSEPIVVVLPEALVQPKTQKVAVKLEPETKPAPARPKQKRVDADQPMQYAYARTEELPMQQYFPVEQLILNTFAQSSAAHSNANNDAVDAKIAESLDRFTQENNNAPQREHNKLLETVLPVSSNTQLKLVEEPAVEKPVHQLDLVREDATIENTPKSKDKTAQEKLFDELSVVDADGNTALHRAVIDGNEQKVREILNPFIKRMDLAARLIHEIKNNAGLSAAELANHIDNFNILLVIIGYL